MAAAKEKGDASGETPQAGKEPSLEDLLKSLNLKEEDIEGLFVAKEGCGGSEGGGEVDGSDAAPVLKTVQRCVFEEDYEFRVGTVQGDLFPRNRGEQVFGTGKLSGRLEEDH
jgi:hypothetical protein